MKPDARKFERLLKKIVREESIPDVELVYQWKTLGRIGDRILIQLLNRQDGWNAFVHWASGKPEAIPYLGSLIDRAGITTHALETLQKAGVQPSTGDTPRSIAIWIQDAVLGENKKEWPRARLLMLENEDLFQGTLDLLEQHGTPAVLAFLTTVLEEALNSERDRALRKALYRLKQKGLSHEPVTSGRVAERELFVFGENRIARWQPILYFRLHSAASETGDLYVIQLEEGKAFGIAEQQRDVQLDARALQELAGRYSVTLERQSGLKIDFKLLTPPEARFFLGKSAQLLAGNAGDRAISDFLKFIGSGRGSDPSAILQTHQGYVPDLQQASSVLETQYFQNWIFTTDETQAFVSELERMEQGPIILPPAQSLEMRHKAGHEWLGKYFDARNRHIWALAFEKAAFFLRDADFYQAQSSWVLSKAFEDPEIPVDTIPAAAFLLDRSLQFVTREKKTQGEEEKRGSLIVSPQEYIDQQRRKG